MTKETQKNIAIIVSSILLFVAIFNVTKERNTSTSIDRVKYFNMTDEDVSYLNKDGEFKRDFVNEIDTEEPYGINWYLDSDCYLLRKYFPISKISLYEKRCPFVTDFEWPTFVEKEDGKIYRKFVSGREDLVIEVFTKTEKETPLEIMRLWYNYLNDEQKSRCQINKIDEEPSYYQSQRPFLTLHKERYSVDITQAVIDEALDKYDGIPGVPEYDYICGEMLGGPFDMTSPYFEFDNRSPERYLFIHLRWNDDGPNIDLNTIRF